MNQIHKSSIQTEYNDTEQNEKLYRMPSFASQRLSHQDIYAHKLQANLKEMAKAYKANKPMVQQLECQRRFFKRICEKQKEKLQQVDPNLVRSAYEEELSQLREKRSKLHEMLSRLHQDSQNKRTLFIEMSNCLTENHSFLKQSLQEIEVENQEYELMLRKKKAILKTQEQRLEMNSEAISEKERIEEKYNLIRSEIHMREVTKKVK